MTDGYVDNIVDLLTCTLKVNTYGTASTSTVEWFSLKDDVTIDGGSTSNFAGYDGFFVTSQADGFNGANSLVEFPVESLG